MTELTETVSPQLEPQDILNQSMQAVVLRMNDLAQGLGLEVKGQAFSLSNIGIVNSAPSAVNGGFRFWGSIADGFSNIFYDKTAFIKDIVIPQKGIGVGGRVVDAWEQVMKEQGVRNFAATNIKDNPDSMRFWEKHGYSPVGRVKNGIPYAMVKTVGD